MPKQRGHVSGLLNIDWRRLLLNEPQPPAASASALSVRVAGSPPRRSPRNSERPGPHRSPRHCAHRQAMAEDRLVGHGHLSLVDDEAHVRPRQVPFPLRVPVVRQRSPAVRVDHVRALVAVADLVSHRKAAAARRGVLLRRLHEALVEHVLGTWTKQADVHPVLRGDHHHRVSHRCAERLRVPCPGEAQLLSLQLAHPLLERHRQRQLLAGVNDRLHVDDRNFRMPGERLDQRVFTVVLPVLEAGECAHRDEVAVARQHFGDLDDMLLGLAVHYLSGIELDPPHAVARLQDDRRAPSWAAPI